MKCTIIRIAGNSVWGETPDNKLVVMKACAEGLRGVRIGDTVSFNPKPFYGKNEFIHHPDFFGNWPRIIDRAPQTNNPVAWKKRQDSSADHKDCREAMAGAKHAPDEVEAA